MRTLISVVVLTMLVFVGATTAQLERPRPRPPGLIEAEKQESRPLEPPVKARQMQADPIKLNQEAKELQKLAETIPGQIEHVNKNQLPQDLINNLKQIEKLAKRLRSEVSSN